MFFQKDVFFINGFCLKLKKMGVLLMGFELKLKKRRVLHA